VAVPTDALADGGGITLKGTTDKTIAWLDATDAWTSSERFSVPLGSASAPALTFTGDPNTGIYSPGADQVAISTNGSSRLYVASDGKVGIETNFPTHKLDVRESGTAAAVVDVARIFTSASSTAESRLLFGTFANTVNAAIGAQTPSGTAGVLKFYVDASDVLTERMRLDSTGRLGLGTSSPQTLLEIRGLSDAVTGGSTPVAFRISDNGTDAGAATWSTTADYTQIQFFSADATNPGGANIRNSIGSVMETNIGQSSALTFKSYSGGTATERMRITSGGLVGIGTTSPASLLDLQGGSVRIGTSTSGNSTASILVGKVSSGGGSVANRLTLGSYGIAHGAFIEGAAEYSGSTGTSLILGTQNAGASAGALPVERARIDSAGRLLVGTSSSRGLGAESALQVEGASAAAGATSIVRNTNDAGGPSLQLGKSRGTANGSSTIVITNDVVGAVVFRGADGNNLIQAATIVAAVDGTPGANDMPGRLVFSTTADGAAFPTERLRIDSAGQIEAGSLGTAAAPVWSFLSDPNTGLYSPGADQVAISTAGTGRLFVNQNGNVAINTSSYSGNFHIYAPSGGVTTVFSANTANAYEFSRLLLIGGNLSANEIYFGDGLDSDIGKITYNNDGNYLAFTTNAAERLRITSDGKVGLGTSSPAYRLHVDGGTGVGTSQAYFGSSSGFWRIVNAGPTTTRANLGGFNSSSVETVRFDPAGASWITGGSLGIGTTSPISNLHVGPNATAGRISLTNNNTGHTGADGFMLSVDAAQAADVWQFENAPLRFGTNNTERAQIDASGRLLVGTSSARGVGSSFSFPIQNENNTAAGITLATNSNNTESAYLVLGKSRGTSIGSNTIVQANDAIGRIVFAGADGTDLETRAAMIEAFVDGTPGPNDMPGRLVFSTTSDNAATPTERMRLDSSGRLGLGTSTASANLHIKNTSTTATELLRLENNFTSPSGNRSITWADGTDVLARISVDYTSPTAKMRFGSLFNSGYQTSDLMTLTPTGLGIGTTSPSASLQIANSGAGSANQRNVIFTNGIVDANFIVSAWTGVSTGSSGDVMGSLGLSYGATRSSCIQFHRGGGGPDGFMSFTANANTERMRIDASGRLLVGTSTARANLFNSSYSPRLQIESASNGSGSSIALVSAGNGQFNEANLCFAKSRGNTLGDNTIVQSGDDLGGITFQGSDGSEFVVAASVFARVDGTPGANDMPGRLVFSTTADGAASPTERMRINSSGQILAGALGTAALPIISFLNDPNTGIYSPGADQVAISTNGTGRLFVDGSGNIGVNTGSPLNYSNRKTLTLQDTWGGQLTIAVAGTAHAHFGTDNFNSGQSCRIESQDGIVFYPSGVEKLRLDSTGRLGLGTSAPDSKLVIQQNSSDTNPLDQNTPSTSSGLSVRNYNFGVGTYTALSLETADSASIQSASIIAQSVSGGLSPNLLFTQRTAASVNTTRMVIDSSGRVGIGTTTPGENLSVWGAASNPGVIGINGNSGQVSRLQFKRANTDRFKIECDTSDNLLFYSNVSTAERARIDASGRLLVGTSSSRGVGGAAEADLQVEVSGTKRCASFVRNGGTPILAIATTGATGIGDTTLVSDGNILGQIEFSGADGTDLRSIGATITAFVDGTPGANDMPGRLVFSTTADGASSPTERMRINSAGALLFGQTTSTQIDGTNTAGVSIEPSGRLGITRSGATTIALNRTTSDGTIVEFKRQASVVGTISVTAAATAYNTSSDYRLKENIAPLTGAIDRLQQIPVHRFNFIADPDKTVDGFIAHEAQAVVPECVTGTKDEIDAEGNPVYQGIDQSKLVPLLTAALQEALQKIEGLEARLTAAGL
jgi:hypothetical protein